MLKLPNRPQIKREALEDMITKAGVDLKKYPALIVGIRGYFRDTMGVKGKNDRGIVSYVTQALNQHGDVLLISDTKILVFRKSTI